LAPVNLSKAKVSVCTSYISFRLVPQ
jgi:hypothetical protein